MPEGQVVFSIFLNRGCKKSLRNIKENEIGFKLIFRYNKAVNYDIRTERAKH